MSHKATMQLLVERDDEGRILLKSPGVGNWFQAPERGHLASTGQNFGVLDQLGKRYTLEVPAGVQALVVERPALATTGTWAVEYGQVLAVLDPAALGEGAELAQASDDTVADGAMVFRSNSSGRYYGRPAPDKPAFVSEGDVVESGQTVFLLEVMKTFSRVSFGGEGLPERAKVIRILPNDGDDLEPGQVVLELEAC